MTTYHMPRRLLMRDRLTTWDLVGQDVSGGRALSGVMPAGEFSGGGYWVASLSDLQVSSAALVKQFRALRSILAGRTRALVLEARDELTAPWPTYNSAQVISGFTDDGTIVNSSAFYTPRVIQCTLSSNAALRASSVVLAFTAGTYSALVGGERFTIDHTTNLARMYEINTVSQAGDVWTCGIRPPLREAESAGKAIDFDFPRCMMQLADSSQMSLPMTRMSYGQSSIKLVESFPPFAA